MSLQSLYESRWRNALKPAEPVLDRLLRSYLEGIPRIDRVGVRAKSVARFLGKAAAQEDGVPKYSDPLSQIQDQLGARIVTFYLDDVDRVCAQIQKYFSPIERKTVVPDSESEFGYFGKHFILLVPSEVGASSSDPGSLPLFFELQVKTLFQHAWAEANHDLAYKPGVPLSSDQKRKVAFTAAQAWGADMVFEELRQVLVAE